ncbi:MAG TPA: tetratricopeptide repeat protein [Gemmatimonadales bacterium]|jgi:tetratricopeptide (TPR) repeat protein|nr:tetratricopeptide repeat protein [Gemmatimonadales bacterium]
MTTRTIVHAFAASLAAVPLPAQQAAPGGSDLRLAQGQPPKYTPPLCNLKAMNAKVENGSKLLRKAYDAKAPAERSTSLEEAKRTLLLAITQEAQASNGAAWYFLGRVALLQGDPAAVDSAFTKAVELAPSCELDINQYRQNSWALLANAALEFQRKGQTDSALTIFRHASFLFRGLPHVFSNMGVVFANTGMADSAAVYFGKALEIAERDTSLTEDRNVAALNLAVMYQRTNRHPEAIAMLHKYLAWKPDDMDAKRALAVSFRNAGMADSAGAIETSMVETFSKGNLDSLDLQDLMSVGVAAFNAGKYQDAANAFGKALKRNPWSRDSRFNLANSYLALKDYPMLVEQATKLLEIEPMSEDALKLLAQGQRNLKQDEAVLKTAERLVGLPFTLEVTGFQMSAGGATFSGEAVGRSPQDVNGKPLKAAPMTLVLEFVDTNGQVMDTRELSIPVLVKEARHKIEAQGKGTGIVGWRYRAR